MWIRLQEQIDFEDPTPLIDLVYLRCTHGEGKVGDQAFQSKSAWFKISTTTGGTQETHQANDDEIRWWSSGDCRWRRRSEVGGEDDVSIELCNGESNRSSPIRNVDGSWLRVRDTCSPGLDGSCS